MKYLSEHIFSTIIFFFGDAKPIFTNGQYLILEQYEWNELIC